MAAKKSNYANDKRFGEYIEEIPLNSGQPIGAVMYKISPALQEQLAETIPRPIPKEAAKQLVTTTPPTTKPPKELVETIPRPIHQAAAKQLVTTTPPELLCVLVKPKHLSKNGLDMNTSLAIIREGNLQTLFFYWSPLEEGVGKAVQSYYADYAISMQTIGIEDPMDFVELLQKIPPTTCGEKCNTSATISAMNFERFCREMEVCPCPAWELNGNFTECCYLHFVIYPWSSLPLSVIEKALESIPKQVGQVECAANSAARALILIEVDGISQNYNNFRIGCPQDIRTITEKRALTTHILGSVAAVALGPFSWIASLVSMGVVFANGAVQGAVYGGAIETGPSPWELARYITKHIPRTSHFKYATVGTYHYFSNCAAAIVEDVKQEKPVICFFLWSLTAWHYATVVAVKEGGNNSNNPEGFAILDTNSSIHYRVYDNMEHVMYNKYKVATSFCVGGSPNNYTIIRFVRR